MLLAVLAQEIELDLSRRWGPFEIVQGLGGLDLNPACSSLHHTLDNILIVTQEQNVLVQLSCAASLV